MKKTILSLLSFASILAASAQNTSNNGSSKQTDSDDLSKMNPVLRSYVPPDVVHKAIQKYGRSLYCISEIKTTDSLCKYMVGLLRNGHLINEVMCDLKIAINEERMNNSFAAVYRRNKSKNNSVIERKQQIA